MIEWNVHDPFGQQAAAGMWDSHIRSVFVFLLSFRRVHDDCTGWVEVTLFIFADGETLKLFLTSLQRTQCPSGSINAECKAAFLGIHLTSGSSAYFEV
jgi:hypothetical protein